MSDTLITVLNFGCNSTFSAYTVREISSMSDTLITVLNFECNSTFSAYTVRKISSMSDTLITVLNFGGAILLLVHTLLE